MKQLYLKKKKYRHLYIEGTIASTVGEKKRRSKCKRNKNQYVCFGRTRLCFSHGKNSRVIIIQTSLFSHFCSGRDQATSISLFGLFSLTMRTINPSELQLKLQPWPLLPSIRAKGGREQVYSLMTFLETDLAFHLLPGQNFVSFPSTHLQESWKLLFHILDNQVTR